MRLRVRVHVCVSVCMYVSVYLGVFALQKVPLRQDTTRLIFTRAVIYLSIPSEIQLQL